MILFNLTNIKKGDFLIIKYLNLVSDTKFTIKEIKGHCLKINKKISCPSLTLNAIINKETIKVTLLLKSPIILKIVRV
jgi:ribosomal protein L19